MFYAKDFILQVMGEAEAERVVHATRTLVNPRTWALGVREGFRVTPGFWPVSWGPSLRKGVQRPEQVSSRGEGFAFEYRFEVPRCP